MNTETKQFISNWKCRKCGAIAKFQAPADSKDCLAIIADQIAKAGWDSSVDSCDDPHRGICPQCSAPDMAREIALKVDKAELLDGLKNLFDDWITLVGEDLKEDNADVKAIWEKSEALISKHSPSV